MLLLYGLLMTGLLSNPANAGSTTVLIMGDSLSAAYNIPIEKSWPVLFQQKLDELGSGHRVVNASISGETSAGGLERFPALLQEHDPAIVILELGGNDGLRGFRFAGIQANLDAMIRMALERDTQVLLVGVRLPPNLGPVYNERFQRIFGELARTHPVTFLPRFLEGVAASDPQYMQNDGIHPTAAAQPLLADRVFRSFRSGFIEQVE